MGENFRLKDGYSKSKLYLGSEVFKHQLPNGEICWGSGSGGRNAKNLAAQVKGMLAEEGRRVLVLALAPPSPLLLLEIYPNSMEQLIPQRNFLVPPCR
jgi:hypothetical protein